MKREERVKKAFEKKARGYNCAQAVVCAFDERYNLDESMLMKISEGFGGGMGCGDICGAVTAMGILSGLENADGNLQAPKTNSSTKELSANLKKKFEDKNKSSNCNELRGIETGTVLRSCLGCVEDAVNIFSEYIEEK